MVHETPHQETDPHPKKQKLNFQKILGRHTFLSQAGFSLLNQILLSGFNFAVGICIINLGTKETYGLYSQLFAVSLIVTAILDSFLGTPVTTIAPNLAGSLRSVFIRQIYQYQKKIGFSFSALCGAALTATLAWRGHDDNILLSGLVFASYVHGSAVREYRRTAHFVDSKAERVFRLDFFYMAFAALGGIGLMAAGAVRILPVFSVLSLANYLSVFFERSHQAPHHVESRQSSLKAWHKVWVIGKWALPGAVVGLAGNYSFIFMSAAVLNLSATADLNASRLLLVPFSLLVVAWSRIARPKSAIWIANNNWRQLRRLAWGSLLILLGCGVLYLLILIMTLPWLQNYVLGEKYLNIAPLVWFWAFYFLIYTTRYIATALLVSHGKFRFLLVQGTFDLFMALAIGWYLMHLMGAQGAIIALCIVETIDVAVTWWMLLRLSAKANRA